MEGGYEDDIEDMHFDDEMNMMEDMFDKQG